METGHNFANSLIQLSLQECRNMMPFLRSDEVNQAGLQQYIDQRFPFRNRPPEVDDLIPEQMRPDINVMMNAPILEASYSETKSVIIIADENGIIQATNRPESFPMNADLNSLLSSAEVTYLAGVME